LLINSLVSIILRNNNLRSRAQTNFMEKVLTFVKWILYGSGTFFLSMLLLSFTDIPFNAYYRLASTKSVLVSKPDFIVILGASGMPSPEGLIRTYYGAEAADKYKNAKIIIAFPYNEGADSLLQLNKMARELTLKGIDSARIEYEPFGYNTRTQALNISKKSSVQKNKVSLLIISSPEHMYRAIKTFKKVGFTKVGGLAAFEKPIDEIKLESKENKRSIALSLRYNMWSYLHYEILVLREYVAITYYKINGWI